MLSPPFVMVLKEWIETLGYQPELLAAIYAQESRKGLDWEVNVTERELSRLFGISRWRAKAVIDMVKSHQPRTSQEPARFQPPETSVGAALRGATSQEPAKNQPGSSHDIRRKKKEEVKSTTTTNYPPLFERLWLAYPKTNGSKAAACKVFQRLGPSEQDVEQWLKALAAQRAAKMGADNRGQFHPDFPFLERWLKEARWENAPAAQATIPSNAFTGELL